MQERKYTVLLATNRIDGAGLTREELDRDSKTFDFVPVQGVDAAVARLGSADFDAVLLDLDDASDHCEEVLAAVLKQAGPVPVVVLTDGPAESWTGRALQLGACDCVKKDPFAGDKLLGIVAASADRRQ